MMEEICVCIRENIYLCMYRFMHVYKSDMGDEKEREREREVKGEQTSERVKQKRI